MKKLLLSLLIVLAVIPSAVFAQQDDPALKKIETYLYSQFDLEAKMTAYAEQNEDRTEQTFQEYTVRTEFNRETFEGRFEILHQEQRIYQKIDASEFFIGHMYNDVHINSDLIKMGKDITGDGVPDLVVAEYTGGVHCCLNFYVFTMVFPAKKSFSKIFARN